MMNKPQLLLKVSISLMLFLCLLKMPYGYFQFVRFSALIGFAILTFQSNEQGNKVEAFIYGVLALLFQPFFKVSLGRQLWNMVDVIVGIGLIVTLVKSKNKTISKNRDFYGSQKPIDKSKTIRLNSNDSVVYLKNGLAKEKLKDYYGAIQDYSKAIELNPKDGGAYFIRGNAKIALGDNNGGCLDLKKADELGFDEASDLIKEHCK